MSATEFSALCAAFYAQYEPLIKIFSGALAGTGVLAGVVVGLVMAARQIFQGAD